MTFQWSPADYGLIKPMMTLLVMLQVIFILYMLDAFIIVHYRTF